MNDEALYNRAFRFSDKNYDRTAKTSAGTRDIQFLAPNYRMNELQGAVALAQLKKLKWICERRNRFGDGITDGIKGLPGIYPHKVINGCRSSYWFYMFRIDDTEAGVNRDDFSKALAAEGIPSSAGYIPNCIYEYDLFTGKNAYPGTDCPFGCKYYGKDIEYRKGLCPNAENIIKTAVRLTVNEFYTEQDLKDVTAAVKKVSDYYRQKSR